MAAPPPYKHGVFALSAICGLVDAACFLALGGVFAELMTGNLLLIAFALAAGNLFGAHALACLFAILPFCLGALVAGRRPLGAQRAPAGGPAGRLPARVRGDPACHRAGIAVRPAARGAARP
jgi:hypothetical protein